jgi:hypothetical protein
VQRKDVGACTTALLKILYSRRNVSNLSWVDALHQWRSELQEKGHDGYLVQLSSSHRMDIKDQPLYLVPPNFVNRGGRCKRAILIGIAYQGQEGELVRVCVLVRP